MVFRGNRLCRLKVIAVLCLLATVIQAQDYPLFFVDSIGLFGVPVAGSAHWLGADCSTEAYTVSSPYVEDVSIAPNGFVYGIGYSVNPGVDVLYEVETTGAPNYWGSLGFVQVTDVAQSYKGLACDSLSRVYLAGDRLARYHNGNLQELGNFPPGMECQGDLCFRYGKLYMSTVSHQLLEVNPANPGAGTIVMDFPAWAPPIDALATVKVDCDSVITYAIGRGTGVSKLYEIDFQNQSLIEICELPKTVVGLASPTEALPPPCAITLDLDADDQTDAIYPNINLDTTCTPSVDYGTAAIVLESEIGYIESVQVQLNDILDAGGELLFFPPAANIGIQNNNSPSVTLFNLGTATPDDFAQLLSQLVYQNTMANFSFGTRTIEVTAFANVYQSDPAYAYITLSNQALLLSPLATPPSCYGDSDGTITLTPSGGTAPYTFLWDTGGAQQSLNDLAAGTYTCTVTDDQGCWKSGSFNLLAPDSLVLVLETPPDNLVCAADASIAPAVSGGTAPYQFEWSSGQVDSLLTGLGAGTYALTLSDQQGCQATAAIDLQEETILEQVQEQRCEGDIYHYQGLALSTDTSFCVLSQTALGCDSLFCLDLHYSDTALTLLQQTLCQGESASFNGQEFFADTLFQTTYATTAGCDSTVIFELDILENQTALQAAICAGESYEFAGIALAQTGYYRDTLTTANGCDSILLLNLTVHPNPQPEINVNGHFCQNDLLQLSSGAYSSYLWSPTNLSTPNIDIIEPGTYALTVTDAFGCTGSTSLEIPAPAVLEVDFQIDPIPCAEETSAQLRITEVIGGQAPYSYALDGSPFQSTAQFEQLHPGDYQLQVMDSNGCTADIPILIGSLPSALIDAGRDTLIRLGESVQLEATTNISNPAIQWSPVSALSCTDCLQPLASPVVTTTFSLEIVDLNGCKVQDQVTVLVDGNARIYAPNAFSPNGDGINDLFFLQSDFNYHVLELSIFDRWGNLIFQRYNFSVNEVEAGWDGWIDSAMPAGQGTYLWLAKIRNLNGLTEILTGSVSIVK